MPETPLDQVITELRAAGEPTRLRLLRLLARAELTVTELTQILGQSQPRVSRHLKLLADAGLVQKVREGTWAFYRLADGGEAVGVNGGTAAADAAGFAELIVALVPEDDPVVARDAIRLDGVRAARAELAAAYFRDNAGEWDRLRRLHLPEDEIEAAMVEMVAPLQAGDLVDLGTGTGRVLEVLAPHVTRGIGIDVSREMLAVARANLEAAGVRNCHVRQGDILSLPLDDGSADLVTLHHVLHYLGEPAKAVDEAARLLRPGGHLLIVDFAPHELEILRTEHAHRRLGFADAEVRGWVQRAGLDFRSVRDLPPAAPAADKLTVKFWLGRRPDGGEAAAKGATR